jgi:hypothetical protein
LKVGLIESGGEDSYLTEPLMGEMAAEQGYSIHYRIATGSLKGKKIFFL